MSHRDARGTGVAYLLLMKEKAAKKPRQVTVQPQEPKPEKGNPRVPPNQEDETPRRGLEDQQDERTGQNRDGLHW
jgi:hypothetical protein